MANYRTQGNRYIKPRQAKKPDDEGRETLRRKPAIIKNHVSETRNLAVPGGSFRREEKRGAVSALQRA
jgi:hypothetical protein